LAELPVSPFDEKRAQHATIESSALALNINPGRERMDSVDHLPQSRRPSLDAAGGDAFDGAGFRFSESGDNDDGELFAFEEDMPFAYNTTDGDNIIKPLSAEAAPEAFLSTFTYHDRFADPPVLSSFQRDTVGAGSLVRNSTP